MIKLEVLLQMRITRAAILCILLVIAIFAVQADAHRLNDDALALMAAIRCGDVRADLYPDAMPAHLAMMVPPMQFERLPISGGHGDDVQSYRFPVHKEGVSWQVLALFNEQDTPAILHLNIDKLFGIDSGSASSDYMVYDVFTKQIMGIYPGEADVIVKMNSARLLTIRPYDGRPLLMSIGNHIGQGYHELIAQRWDDAISAMQVTTKGLEAADTLIRLYVPDGWKLRSLAVRYRSAGWKELRGQIYEFTIPDANDETTWIATFDGGIYKGPVERLVSSKPLIAVKPDVE